MLHGGLASPQPQSPSTEQIPVFDSLATHAHKLAPHVPGANGPRTRCTFCMRPACWTRRPARPCPWRTWSMTCRRACARSFGKLSSLVFHCMHDSSTFADLVAKSMHALKASSEYSQHVGGCDMFMLLRLTPSTRLGFAASIL